jgi:hypothetical protein
MDGVWFSENRKARAFARLEHGFIPDETLAREISRRLSPGIPADFGAGWIEALPTHNRYALAPRVAHKG